MLAGETVRPTVARALGMSATAQNIARLNRIEAIFIVVCIDAA
jgi:hypothetical protein